MAKIKHAEIYHAKKKERENFPIYGSALHYTSEWLTGLILMPKYTLTVIVFITISLWLPQHDVIMVTYSRAHNKISVLFAFSFRATIITVSVLFALPTMCD